MVGRGEGGEGERRGAGAAAMGSKRLGRAFEMAAAAAAASAMAPRRGGWTETGWNGFERPALATRAAPARAAPAAGQAHVYDLGSAC